MNEHEQPDTPERAEGKRPGGPEQRETQPRPKPRIWVGSLADYNDGVLHGDWLDAWAEPDELGRGIARILESSPTPGAEEHAIFDYDDFAGIRISEHESLESVSRLARGVREHGPAFAAWAELVDHDPDALADFESAYIGHYPSLRDYADEMLDDLGYTDALHRVVPDWLRPYVRLDPDLLAGDLNASGHVITAPATGGGIWIFDNNYR